MKGQTVTWNCIEILTTSEILWPIKAVHHLCQHQKFIIEESQELFNDFLVLLALKCHDTVYTFVFNKITFIML